MNERTEFYLTLVRDAVKTLDSKGQHLAARILELVPTGDCNAANINEILDREWDEEVRAREVHDYDMNSARFEPWTCPDC